MTQRFFRKLCLALGCLALAVPPAAVAKSSPQSAPTRLPTGTGEFTFDAWAGPQLKVWTYVPDGIDPATAPILIVMHGVNRDADRYLAQWRGPAGDCGFVVIAPEFSRSRFPGSNAYNLGHITASGQTGLRPRKDWSFAAIEPLFDEVVARLGGSQQGYTLYGHSAGSQFVHRLLLTGHGGRATRVLAANAFGTKTVLMISVMGFLTGRPDFLDIALLYALLNFIGTIAVLKFFRYRTLGDQLQEEEKGGKTR